MDKLVRLLVFVAVALVMALGIACGANEDDSDDSATTDSERAFPTPTAAMMIIGASSPTPAPRSEDAMDDSEFAMDDIDMEDEEVARGSDGTDSTTLNGGYPPVSAQNRLIVRIVDMTIEVDDVVRGIEDVGDAAVRHNGWVVSEQRSSRHAGQISVRVPSAQLDDAVRAISALGVNVVSLSSTSQDVTEEYFDVQSRITNLWQTRAALQELLNRKGELEDILEVQREITRVSEEIEVLEGRSRYLEQTSATSLINVWLELAPGMLEVDAGPDLRAVEGDSVTLRATFREPEGIETYSYWWDYGDGNTSARRTRTARTETPGERITETVRYVYGSGAESPFFVEFNIIARGDAGVFEGKDSLKVIVGRVPTVTIDLAENIEIRAGDEVTLSAAFSRPNNVSDLRWEWDFGDGLEPETGDVGEGENTIAVTHEYQIARAYPYEARVTLRGETDFGATVSSTASVFVSVEPQPDWVVGIINVDDTIRAGTRTLGYIAQGLIVFVIWAALLSPVWGPIIALIWFLRRRALKGTPG